MRMSVCTCASVCATGRSASCAQRRCEPVRAARAQVTAPSPTTSGVRSTALLTSPRCVCVYIALMVCHGASHKSGLSQPRARANIPRDTYNHNAAPTPSPRFGGQHAFPACRKLNPFPCYCSHPGVAPRRREPLARGSADVHIVLDLSAPRGSQISSASPAFPPP